MMPVGHCLPSFTSENPSACTIIEGLFITDKKGCADIVSSVGDGDQKGGSGLFYAHQFIHEGLYLILE